MEFTSEQVNHGLARPDGLLLIHETAAGDDFVFPLFLRVDSLEVFEIR
jgi:hypothetical protein